MPWRQSHRADPLARAIADRHYNRRHVGAPQFVPPGRCLVLITPEADALWVTSYQEAVYARHAWAGCWVCSCFRNESAGRASEMIREAVVITRWMFGDPTPVNTTAGPISMVTFIDRRKVRPTHVRGRRVWGFTYRKAGWVEIGETAGGLLALGLPINRTPGPRPPARVKYALAAEDAPA